MIASLLRSLSPEQQAAAEYLGGNAYVAAGPGTGKTHLLVARYQTLFDAKVAPERILVLTFSRRAAAELRERIVAALRSEGQPAGETEVRTFHGFASRVLDANGARFRTRRLLDGFSRELLIDAAIASTPMPSLGDVARQSRSFRIESARLLDDLSRASAESLSSVARDASPRLRDILALQRSVLDASERLRASDLNDLVSRAVLALRDPAGAAAPWAAGRYTHILVDEFQDTDPVQLELLAAMNATVFAVGDEAQSIYRFRGAKHGIVEIAVTRLAMTRFGLTVSRRCPPAVCALAKATPFVGALAPSAMREDGPPVSVHALRTMTDEVHFVADRIEAAIDAGTPASEIAVLLRATRPFGPLLADELRRRAIPVVESSRDAIMADPRIIALRAAFTVLAAPSDAAAWRRLLTAQPLGFDPLAVRLAGKVLASMRIDAELSSTLDAAQLKGHLPNAEFAAALRSASDAWTANDLGTATRRLGRGLSLLRAILRDEPENAVRSAAARLQSFCDGLAAAQRTLRSFGRPATCADIVAQLDEHMTAFVGDDGARQEDVHAVRVLSVHAAKGLEFELVVIADAVDGRFPQNARRSTLLSAEDRALLLASGVDGASVTDATDEEEASLWYVAVTRAKRDLLITYARENLGGREQRPSRFLTGRIPERTTPVDRISLEIAALTSDDEAAHKLVSLGLFERDHRRAPSPALRAYATHGPAAFSAVEPRALPVPKRLSVGNAVTWLECPRKLFYNRFIGLAEEESTPLTLGTAIHAVLQSFHADQTDFTSVNVGDAKRWTVELHALRQTVWSETQFDGSIISEAAGIFADRVLTAYAAALESRAIAVPFNVAACEESIDVPVGPLTFSGRIDRVDRRAADNAAILIDYKTGKAKDNPFRKELTKAAEIWQAGNSLAGTATHQFAAQLAFYASAMDDVVEFAYIYLKGDGKAGVAATDATNYDETTQAGVAQLIADIRVNFIEPLAAGTAIEMSPARTDKPCGFCTAQAICPGPQGDDE